MQDARDDRAVVNARLARRAARQVRAVRLPASSDSQNKLFAMTVPSRDSNQAQIYNQINKLYEFST
jgi:acetolactate synthase regulatory subunit